MTATIYDDIDFGPPDDPASNIQPMRPGAAPLRQRMLTRGQLANLPEPRPLIDRTIDLGTVSVLAGYWGTCKSFIGLDWAASVATGRAWQHRDVAPRRVLYIAGEGAYGLHKRLRAWEENAGRDILDEQLTVITRPVHLLRPLDVLELCGVMKGDGYGYVVVDTVSKSIPGADENSAKDMSVVVDSLYRILDATDDGAVTAVHHTGKDKTTIRGSSSLEAGVDTVYLTEGDPQNLRLSRTKRKDGPLQDVLNLQLHDVPGTGSAVIDSVVPSGNSASAMTLLEHFDNTFSETGATKKEIVDTCGLAAPTAYRAINHLAKTGQLVNAGTDARPRYVRGLG